MRPLQAGAIHHNLPHRAVLSPLRKLLTLSAPWETPDYGQTN